MLGCFGSFSVTPSSLCCGHCDPLMLAAGAAEDEQEEEEEELL